MSQLTMKGTIEKVLKAETGKTKAGKEWKKQYFVLNNGDKYNPNVCFDVFGEDKIKEVVTFKKGDEVEISFNLSSREHNGRWYTQASAWKSEVLSGGGKVPAQSEADFMEEGEDTLPF